MTLMSHHFMFKSELQILTTTMCFDLRRLVVALNLSDFDVPASHLIGVGRAVKRELQSGRVSRLVADVNIH